MTDDPNHTDESTPKCPTCGEEFKTNRAMKSHHAQVHGESLVAKATCAECGDEFRESHGSNKYCSLECVGRSKRNRITLECGECGDSFTAIPSEADDRQYCSRECSHDASRIDKRYTCAQCDREFRNDANYDPVYCCEACRCESYTTRPRPDDTEFLLWLLYVYEGYNLTETFRRQRAVLGYDDRLYKTEVRDLLVEMGVFERMHQRVLSDNDGDLLGETPAGDDSWKQFYGGAADD